VGFIIEVGGQRPRREGVERFKGVSRWPWRGGRGKEGEREEVIVGGEVRERLFSPGRRSLIRKSLCRRPGERYLCEPRAGMDQGSLRGVGRSTRLALLSQREELPQDPENLDRAHRARTKSKREIPTFKIYAENNPFVTEPTLTSTSSHSLSRLESQVMAPPAPRDKSAHNEQIRG
jgi:hypothetical protein